jgi:O-antigen/teichoic acid export membrane protein
MTKSMFRIRRFAHSLMSGYMVLGATVLFTLGSFRLAKHYLDQAQFGLWANIAQIAGFMALMDFGLGFAASRILIDYKEHPNAEEYGGTILTGALVGLSQAGLILLAGPILALSLGPLLAIPTPLEHKFVWLVIGQCVVTATAFVTRIMVNILVAHQRFDVFNYSIALGLVANFATMWWSFARGHGVFSLLWGQAASAMIALAVNGIGGYTLQLFPQKGHWGRPTWPRFRELFIFGRDAFLFTVGNQFVNLSQTLLLTRLINLDAAGNWSVCTKAYLLLLQTISSFFQYSASALAEMMIRGERERLLRRFREITVVSVNLAVAAGALLAVANGPFVKIWMAGEFGWSPWNDLLLAIWLVMTIEVRMHTGLVGQTKAFRFLRYLYFFEGFAFIGLTVLLHRFGGITMMLTISIMCSLSFTFLYGLWRTREYFHLKWGDLAAWHRSTLTLAATVAPVAAIDWWLVRNLPALQQLVADSVLGIWTALMFFRYGLGSALRAEACRRAPSWARPVLARMGFAKPEA